MQMTASMTATTATTTATMFPTTARANSINFLKQNNQPATTEADWQKQQQNRNTSGNKQQWQISNCSSNVLSFTNKIHTTPFVLTLEDLCTTLT